MPIPTVLIAGEAPAGEALAEALREQGVGAHFQPSNGLAEAFAEIESHLEESRPAGVVAVGTGEGALTLAITAAKLGIPVARAPGDEGPAPDGARILATLAGLDAGAEGERAADLIAAWVRGDPPAAGNRLTA